MWSVGSYFQHTDRARTPGVSLRVNADNTRPWCSLVHFSVKREVYYTVIKFLKWNEKTKVHWHKMVKKMNNEKYKQKLKQYNMKVLR